MTTGELVETIIDLKHNPCSTCKVNICSKCNVQKHYDLAAEILETMKNDIMKGEINKKYGLPRAEKTVDWIPISEKLPEEFRTVMVTVIEEIRGIKSPVLYAEARYSKKYGWEWAYESGADYWEEIDGVIAWMPLPEPYKEESEEV